MTYMLNSKHSSEEEAITHKLVLEKYSLEGLHMPAPHQYIHPLSLCHRVGKLRWRVIIIKIQFGTEWYEGKVSYSFPVEIPFGRIVED